MTRNFDPDFDGQFYHPLWWRLLITLGSKWPKSPDQWTTPFIWGLVLSTLLQTHYGMTSFFLLLFFAWTECFIRLIVECIQMSKRHKNEPVTPRRPWWEPIAVQHAERDTKAGRLPGRCPCLTCQRAREEGFWKRTGQ